ncbi:hypothetical protein ACFQX7_13225 [Luedemannella flava]
MVGRAARPVRRLPGPAVRTAPGRPAHALVPGLSAGPRRSALLGLGAISREATVRFAAELHHEFLGPQLDTVLSAVERPRARLCRAGDLPGLVGLAAVDRGVTARPDLLDAAWRQGALEVAVAATLVDPDGVPLLFHRDGDRVYRIVPPELAGTLTDEELDVTDLLRGRVELGVRGRSSRVEWVLPSHGRVEYVDTPAGTVARGWCAARLYPGAAAYGRPLDERLWDLTVRFTALGYVSHRAVPARGGVGPALIDGRAVVPFAASDAQLSVDLGLGTAGLLPAAGLTPADVTHVDARLELRLPPIHLDGFAAAPGEVIVGGVGYPAECRTIDGRSLVRAPVPPMAHGPVSVRLVDEPAATGLILVPGPDGRSHPRREAPLPASFADQHEPSPPDRLPHRHRIPAIGAHVDTHARRLEPAHAPASTALGPADWSSGCTAASPCRSSGRPVVFRATLTNSDVRVRHCS